MTKIFIDGRAGTTGLQIEGRMRLRDDVTLIELPEAMKKDPAARKGAIQEADYVFLCLPDAAAKEAADMVEDSGTRIIDASTAHRTDPAWAYGFPELSKAHRQKIETAQFVANPGCHATGFISLVYPLVQLGILPPDYPLAAHSLTGYTGGGKKMIAEYESAERGMEYDSPRQYALGQKHKHLPEMKAVCGLEYEPIFNPIVADFFSGMCVSAPIYGRLLQRKMTVNQLKAFYKEYYASSNFIEIAESDEAYLAANLLTGTNMMRIFVAGNDDRILLASVFDNLGKGASGAAVQCMNIMSGLDERVSLF